MSCIFREYYSTCALRILSINSISRIDRYTDSYVVNIFTIDPDLHRYIDIISVHFKIFFFFLFSYVFVEQAAESARALVP